jgi:phospholipid/cholesterol/gamma-HCH transport system substrate-binding protein
MAATKSQKIRLGLFGIGAAAAALMVVVVFAGIRFWERHDRYVIDFEDSVLGLEEGAAVSFGGIKVGTVTDISVAPGDLRKVRVTIKVKRGLPIRTDTTATLSMAGITGLKSIDLHGGEVDAPPLPPGGSLTVGETTLDRFERQAKALVDSSQQLMGHANAVLVNLEELTEPAHFQGMAEIMESARQASANLADATAGLRDMVAENRAPIRRTLESVDQVTGRAAKIMDGDVPRLMQGAGNLVDEARGVVRDNGSYLRSAMFDLRQAARSLKDTARDVRQQPSRLLFSKPARERKLP